MTWPGVYFQSFLEEHATYEAGAADRMIAGLWHGTWVETLASRDVIGAWSLWLVWLWNGSTGGS